MLTRILVLIRAARVLCIEPGSVEVSEEKRTRISRELVEGRWLSGESCQHELTWGKRATHPILLRAISKPFCKLGSPDGSNFRLSANAARIACGFPPISMIISARPSRRPMIPICAQRSARVEKLGKGGHLSEWVLVEPFRHKGTKVL